MAFSVKYFKDDFLDKNFKKIMKELNKFFGLRWIFNLPNVFIIKNREDINKLKGEKTEPWSVGWSNGKNVFILDRKNFEKESSHKYSDKYYLSLIKHELVHAFVNCYSNYPIWLNEGLAVYLSGQLSFMKEPQKFRKFLKYYKHHNKEVYAESGYAVKFLVEKYGKRKMKKLLKGLRQVKNKKGFYQLFEDVYKKKLEYKIFNQNLF